MRIRVKTQRRTVNPNRCVFDASAWGVTSHGHPTPQAARAGLHEALERLVSTPPRLVSGHGRVVLVTPTANATAWIATDVTPSRGAQVSVFPTREIHAATIEDALALAIKPWASTEEDD